MILDITFYRYIAAIGMLGMLKVKGKTTFSVDNTKLCFVPNTLDGVVFSTTTSPDDCGMFFWLRAVALIPLRFDSDPEI